MLSMYRPKSLTLYRLRLLAAAIMVALLAPGCGLSGRAMRTLEPKAESAREKQRQRQAKLRKDYEDLNKRFVNCAGVLSQLEERLQHLFDQVDREQAEAKFRDMLVAAGLPGEPLQPDLLKQEDLEELISRRHEVAAILEQSLKDMILSDSGLREVQALAEELRRCGAKHPEADAGAPKAEDAAKTEAKATAPEKPKSQEPAHLSETAGEGEADL